jgi:hypothetical protein
MTARNSTSCATALPQWMTDAIHAAHGDILPLDWIYEHCSRIVDMMTEYEPKQWDDSVSEWCDGLTDVYNIELAKWLALHLDFAEFVDNATQELGHSDRGIFGDIAMGQYSVLENIAYAMLSLSANRRKRRNGVKSNAPLPSQRKPVRNRHWGLRLACRRPLLRG